MNYDFKKILYVTDLSEKAEYAFGYAYSIAKRFSGKINVLHVIEGSSGGAYPLASTILGESKWKELIEKNKQSALDAIKQRISDSCSVMCSDADFSEYVEDVVVTFGSAENVILGMVDKQQFDLVIIGAHAVTAVGKALLDYTARHVVRQCTKPVLIIHLPND
ncbi:MAG: universal stress protein [Desulfomonilia bacterium]|jgi:nucleotide-binding universal stress UspA family protein|uniref:Putative universal stress protein n=1 Tax=anaerobic digester metagenome TaxID=1263854 RepID=A0A485LV37_9ZZZZ